MLSLIGVSIVPEDDIPLMVMPYMLHGDVKSYLKSQRGDSLDADRLPNVRTIFDILLLGACFAYAVNHHTDSPFNR